MKKFKIKSKNKSIDFINDVRTLRISLPCNYTSNIF